MPLRDDLLDPIPGDNPAGVNLRYDPVTDKVKELRREDLDVPQGDWKTSLKAADHPAAIKLMSDALVKRGKDLQLAVWLVDSQIRLDGFAALAPCFRFLHDLLDQYWDTLYPLVEDDDVEVRAAPLDWLGSKLADPLGFLPITENKLSWYAYKESRVVGYEADADTNDKQQIRETRLSEGKISAETFDEAADDSSLSFLKDKLEQLNEGLAEAESLSEYCDSKFGDYSPSFLPVRNALEEIAQTVRVLVNKKPQAKVDLPDSEVKLNVKSARTPAPVSDFETLDSLEELEPAPDDDSSGGLSSFSGGAISSLDDATAQLASVCAFLREQDAEDPSPYLVLRSYAWGKMLSNAPMIDRSSIEAPPSTYRVNLKKYASDSEWDQVLQATEEGMSQPWGRTWLDLQRYTVNALEQRGSPATARVVRDSLRGFLEGVPDLLDLTLPDDTPSANAETKSWIENFVKKQYGPPLTKIGGEDSSDSSSSDDTPLDDFSLDTPAETTDDSSDTELASFESLPEPEPEPEAPPEVTVDADPPILENNDEPPTEYSDEFQAAMAAVNAGQTVDGLSIITKLMATERSGRARFRRRTQLAHLLLAAGQPKVAHSLLDHIANEIEQRHLEDWEEGEALAYPLDLLLRCLSNTEKEKRAQLYIRICQLDPVRAVSSPV